jgi:acetyltransferase-like isoleucine patch superfamily enzyme
MIYRPFWAIRAFIYKLFFKKFLFPSYIGKPTFIFGSKKITIGRMVKIFPHCRMEVHGKGSSIIIEDNVGIGQNFHVISGAKLIIGTGTTIAPNVFINNMDNGYQVIGVPIIEQEEIIKETKIGKNCFIGIGASIQLGTILGEQCIVGANAVVKGEFPDYCVIVGNPAKVVKKYNILEKKWQKTDAHGNFIDVRK